MGARDNAYSRAVATAKVILPLIALGMMSSLFLLARPPQQGEPLPYPDLTVLDLAREERLGAPTFSGVTAEGTKVTVAAESLRPDPVRENMILGDALVARLVTPDGLAYEIAATGAEIDRARDVTTLIDDVSITTSNAYDMRMDRAQVASDFSRMESLSPVTVTGPMGRIEAGHMLITQDPDTGTQTRLLFTAGVHLLYVPQSRPR